VLANDVLKSFTPSRNQINFSFGGRGGGSWEERFSRYVNTNVSKQLKKKRKKRHITYNGIPVGMVFRSRLIGDGRCIIIPFIGNNVKPFKIVFAKP